MFVMDEISCHDSDDMEINKDDTAVRKNTAVNRTKHLDMSMDTEMGKDIASLLDKGKVKRKNLTEPSSKPIPQILHIGNYKKDAAVCKELSNKLKCLLKENSSTLKESLRLLHDVKKCLRKEKGRMILHKVVALNLSRGQLKKVWESRRLPFDDKILMLAARNNVFDMSSLNESLPSKPDKTKAQKVAKEFLSFRKLKKQSYRKSEILRILASNAPEPNNNSPSSSSNHHESRSIARMVKRVYGDVENVRIFSFRPLMKVDSNSSVDNKGVSCPKLQELHASHKDEKNETSQDLKGKCKLQNGTSQSEVKTCKLGPETIILLRYPSTNTGKTRSDKQKDDSNILRNPERLLFNQHLSSDERHKMSQITQEVHESISLARQLSRLKIANSRREGIDESEIVEAHVDAPTDQNEGGEEKVAIANRRRVVVESLREKFRRYQLQEAEALKKN